MRKLEQLFFVLMTVVLSYHDCSDVPLTCPGEDVIIFDIICEESNNCTRHFEQKNFTWLNLDKETGQVVLQFNTFDSLCMGYYDFTLEEFETDTEDSCEGIVFGRSYAAINECEINATYHSVKKGHIEGYQENEAYPPCAKSVNVTYNLVYRGCYRLVIREDYDNTIQPLCSPPVFLDTNFTKENIFKIKDLIITSTYNKVQNHMEHTVIGISKMHVPLIELEVRECQPKQKCSDCTTNDTWLMGLDLVGEFKCRRGKNISKCFLRGGNEIICITENVGNLSQCLWVTLLFHPCEGEGVWQNTTIHNHNRLCQWNSPTSSVYAVIEGPVLAEGDQCVTVILGSVFSILAILCFCILLFIMRKKLVKCLHYAPVRPRSYPLVSVMPHILLLYSRDCEPFMDLMVTFRNMLRDVIKSEVYDCFDHALAEEIATGAVEWLNRLLECDNVKIVVVETECAMLHQKALFESVNLSYWEPTWLDDVFIQGLKVVESSKRSSQYDRVFVVSIRGFTGGNDRLEFITPNTRYVIPQHIEELMTNLYRQTDLDYSEHLQKLDRGIRMLEEYKTSNMDYVNHLLRR